MFSVRFASPSAPPSASPSACPTTGLPADLTRVRLLARGVVMAEPGRCVQCGICSHSCPSGIDVRAFARDGVAVTDHRCVLCGSCVARCPRGTLSFLALEARP